MLQSVKSKESERSADTTEKYRVEIVLRLGTAFVGQIHRQLERAFELTIERRFHRDHSLIFSNDSSDSLGRNCIGVRRPMPQHWNAITRGGVPITFSHAHHKASGRSIRTDTGLLAQFRFCCVLRCLIVSRAALADRWLLEPAASNSTPIAELLGVPPDSKVGDPIARLPPTPLVFFNCVAMLRSGLSALLFDSLPLSDCCVSRKPL